MKILYVALSMRGMDDIIDGGKDDKGLPSFVYPLKAFVKDGNEVKIILISGYRKPINIKVDWLKNEDIIYNANEDKASGSVLRRLLVKFKESLKLIKVISNQLKEGQYDFVYCHGKAAILGNIVANYYHIPCGYRIYGTVDMYEKLNKKGVLYTALKYPSYVVLFNLKKKYMLITDDGSHGDYVVNRMRLRDNYKIYLWKNGVDRPKNINLDKDLFFPNCPFLFTAGRVCEAKGIHRSIKVLNSLVKKGYNIDLLIAGPLVDQRYYNELQAMIKNFNIHNRVHFLGDLSRELMQKYAHKANAVLLFANHSNLSNVFIECGIAGSVIISFNEKPLYQFIDNEYNGFLINDYKDAVNIVEQLLNGEKESINRIKRLIKKKMDNSIITWEERCKKEVELVYQYVK